MADGAGDPRRRRRRSAGGQALHRWDKQGKLTTIHVVYEMDAPVPRESLLETLQGKLLDRFPRLRGYVSEDESFWMIPKAADVKDYVTDVTISGTADESVATTLKKYVSKAMNEPLPPTQMWQLRSIRVDPAGHGQTGYYLLWRFSHTAGDGVVLTHIMSNVLCDPPVALESPAATKTSSTDSASGTRSSIQAGLLERIWCFLKAMFNLCTLLYWLPDSDTPFKLGPSKWKKRGGATASDWAVAVSTPVDMHALKQAAKRKGVTVNDLMLAALSMGMRAYLEDKDPGCGAQKKKMTIVVVVNPRPEMPQLGQESKTLQQYANMEGMGCDVSLGFMGLPGGKPDEVLKKVAAKTRELKLSPEVPILRFVSILLCKFCGVWLLTVVYSFLVSKFTSYYSNVVAPQRPASFCGIPIKSMFFATTPLDFGMGINFLTYNGAVSLAICADTASVPDPQLVVNKVQESLLKISGTAVISSSRY